MHKLKYMKNGVLKGRLAAASFCIVLFLCIKIDAQVAPYWGLMRDFARKEALSLGKQALQGFDHVLTSDANIKNFHWYVEFFNPDTYESSTAFFIQFAKRMIKNLPASIYGSSKIKALIIGPKCIDSINKRMIHFGLKEFSSFLLKLKMKYELINDYIYFRNLYEKSTKNTTVDSSLSLAEKYKIKCTSLKKYTIDSEGKSDISYKKLCTELLKECAKEIDLKPYFSSVCSQASGYAIGRVAGAVAPKSIVEKAALLHIPLFIPAIIRTNAHVIKWFNINLGLRKVPGFSRVDKNNKFVNNAQIKVMPLLSGIVHGFNASAQSRLSA